MYARFSGGPGEEPPDRYEERTRFWWQPPDKLREESEAEPPRRSHTTVLDGELWWTYSPDWGAISNVDLDEDVRAHHSPAAGSASGSCSIRAGFWRRSSSPTSPRARIGSTPRCTARRPPRRACALPRMASAALTRSSSRSIARPGSFAASPAIWMAKSSAAASWKSSSSMRRFRRRGSCSCRCWARRSCRLNRRGAGGTRRRKRTSLRRLRSSLCLSCRRGIGGCASTSTSHGAGRWPSYVALMYSRADGRGNIAALPPPGRRGRDRLDGVRAARP